ncbi:hypothetical protein [Pseudoruegeria sp. SHC-113]|uniref:hypothetical protein n=1 Tax=Pseudoruegeria sp. SHC-113 TaxID=2855439 RepID=UPI0021BB4079|nr:hypothetical protein [Pseudoruegeria sp. SHC-113]MCT8161363.1 hypothetical protein [Pseudoruegeria sp. SHC-113]
MKDFTEEEDGAVSVDWVVLTAALVAMTIAILPALYVGVDNSMDDMEATFVSGETFSSQGGGVTATVID